MAHVQYVDELVREYLLFRGFSGTLKSFDAEMKADKDKGFRVDKLVDQLSQHIYSYDLTSLRELWSHLDHKIFSRLEQDFSPAVRKLENAVLKMYVVNAVVNGKTDKLNEFFSRLTPELQSQGEWKDWFAIPFIKNPEESPNFAVHFTRQWQDTLLVSLHNFLATVFQVMPLPTLASLEQEAARSRRLQDENEVLRQRILILMEVPGAASAIAAAGASTPGSGIPVSSTSGVTVGVSAGSLPQGLSLQDIIPPEVPQPQELMDDFYVIAPEGISTHQPSSDSQAKTLKNIIRNIGGLPSSPIMGRKPNISPMTQATHSATVKTKGGSGNNAPPESQHKRSSSKHRLGPGRSSPGIGCVDSASTTGRVITSGTGSAVGRTTAALGRSRTRDSSVDSSKQPTTPPAGAFLLLSQEHYNEHRTVITHSRFNATGSVVASADMDGVIKVWEAPQTLRTVATFSTKSRLLALDWIAKTERYFLAANSSDNVYLMDTQDSRILWEINSENNVNLKGTRLVNLSCSPTEASFLCSAASSQGTGRLLLFDIKSRQLQRSFLLSGDASLAANCFAFNHNGQLAAIGCSDGSVQVFDVRRSDSIDSWQAHSGPAIALQLTPDDTACYTAGADNKLSGRSMTQRGRVLCEAVIPEFAAPVTLPNNLSWQPTQLFVFHQSGKHALLRLQSGAAVYQVNNTMESVLELSSSRSPTVAIDWASANQCSTSVNAHLNGTVTVSSLLTP